MSWRGEGRRWSIQIEVEVEVEVEVKVEVEYKVEVEKTSERGEWVFQLKTSGFGARSCKGYLGDQYVSCVGGQGDVYKVIIQESHPDMDRFAL